MKLIKGFNISTDSDAIYLYYNSKKPYWKHKHFLYVSPNNDFTQCFDSELIDIERVYFRLSSSEEIRPLNEYKNWSYFL